MNLDEARRCLAEVLRDLHRDHSGHPNSTSEADALLPVVRHLAAEELRAAADAYESDAEQPHINYLADNVYRPGDCLSSLWLRARADDLTTADHGKA